MSLSQLPNPLAQTTDLWVSLVRAKAGSPTEDRMDGSHVSVAETRPASVGRKVSSEGKVRILLYPMPVKATQG
jgi:hypothetical protein